jgi:hypothetical protein
MTSLFFNWNDGEVKKNFEKIIRDFTDGQAGSPVVKGVVIASQALLRDAQEIVPFDKGFLQKSGSTTQPKKVGDEVSADVGFNMPYAAKLHEDLTLNISQIKGSKSGKARQQKYLEGPMKENGEKYASMMTKTMAEYLQ